MKDCEIALAAVGALPTVEGALTLMLVAGFVGDAISLDLRARSCRGSVIRLLSKLSFPRLLLTGAGFLPITDLAG